MIKCNFCGHSYLGQARNEKNQNYYRCLRRMGYWKKIYDEFPGKGKTVRRDWIEGVVWNEIKNWILNPVILEEIFSVKFKEYEKEKGNSFNSYRKLRDSIDKKRDERERILELYRRGTITIDDVEKQLKAIESEEKALVQMGEEIKSKMIIDDFPREGFLKSLRAELDSYIGKLGDSSISFEDKRRIVERFVKEVRVNMNGRKLDRVSLVETIPFRNDAEPISSRHTSIVTVYSRDKNTNDERMLEEDNNNFVDVIYQFPFPPKELGVIVNGVP